MARTSNTGKGGRLAALFPGGRTLAVEALVIGSLIVLVGFLVYHFAVHTIRNDRPLGGPNVDVTPATFDQGQASFAIDPTRPNVLFGASNDKGLEVLRIAESSDGGRTWRNADGPAVPGGSCAHGAPSVATGANGREYLAFLASPYCGDSLTPHLVVTSRSGPGARWSTLVRVAPAEWKFGFDDAPDIGVDARSGRVYLVWTRGVSKNLATVVVSSSSDGGATWTAPAAVWPSLVHAHRARVALAPDGDVYVAGIDASGVWVTRSTDHGRVFSKPRAAAPLRANPVGGCALTAGQPLPKELSACEGPDPSLSVGPDRVYVVFDDAGENATPDVYAAVLGRDLKPLVHVQINPAESKRTQQFMPVSTLDADTGVLWACWYDTTFDPHAHRAWFTCSASRNGRSWSAPVRAASVPTSPTILYGTLGTSGLYPAVVARGGVAHAFWADGRIIANSSDVFTAAIPQRTAFSVKP